jgi:hypothetical protein
MLLSIFQSVQPPASSPPTKPTCSSYTTAYNAIALRQTYTCYAVLLVFASISTALLHLTQSNHVNTFRMISLTGSTLFLLALY